MRVAKLSADFRYRSLHLPEVIAGDDSAGIDHQLIFRNGLIGSEWNAREVVYFDENRQPSADCCEASLTPAELGTRAQASAPVGDFPHFWGINQGVLTKRSLAVLRDLIAPHVEFLPLRSAEGEFTAFRVLTFLNALDLEKSEIEWQPQLQKDAGKSRVARQVKRFVFREEQLVNQVIFKLPEMPRGKPFVTESFMRTVDEHQLRGFQFTEVWPPIDMREKFLKKRLKRRR